jgi:hypothetical protein
LNRTATDTAPSASRRGLRPGRLLARDGRVGVVSSEIEQVIEFFGTRREAERMLAEVIADEPDWADRFRVERVELGRESLN